MTLTKAVETPKLSRPDQCEHIEIRVKYSRSIYCSLTNRCTFY